MALDQDMLPAAKALLPLKQGGLDGLCGLYAIINAIRLTTYPDILFSEGQLKRLFKHGINLYRRDRSLAKLVRAGMTERAWCELCEGLLSYVNAEHDAHISQIPLFDAIEPLRARPALEAIKAHLHTGHPVLLALVGAYDHYTVVCGHSVRRLHLFDSGKCQWIRTLSIGVEGDQPALRHRLLPKGAIGLTIALRQPQSST